MIERTIFPSYEIETLLYKEGKEALWRARTKEEGRPLLIRGWVNDPTPAEQEAFLREERSAKMLRESALFRPPSGIEWHRGLPYLLYPDEGLLPLPLFLKKGEMLPVDSFFALAISLAESLRFLHQARIIHRNLHPGVLFVTSRLQGLRIGGLHRLSRLTRRGILSDGQMPASSFWPYMAPEETGRLARSIDERGDLYALGALFYEWLSGAPPFTFETLPEYVYAHLAHTPLPLIGIRPALPPLLSALVGKLLAKEPEERYRSVDGLLHDLKRMKGLWEREGQIPPFPLGEEDAPLCFTLPSKLYGRQREVERLQDAYRRSKEQGPALLLITGAAGVGKSSLVWNAVMPLTMEQGIYLEGKFDPYREEAPYTPLLKAIRHYAAGSDRALPASFEETLCRLEEGEEGAYDSYLSPQEHRQRINTALISLFTSLTQAASPVLLFLDDLQWADSATLHFLHYLLRGGSSLPLLIIGAVRDQEVEEDSPLRPLLTEEGRGELPVEILPLHPLSREEGMHLIADALHAPVEETVSFAHEMETIADGNPLYMLHALEGLEQNGDLIYDPGRKGWRIREGGVKRLSIVHEPLRLISARLERLSPETNRVLKAASCIGFFFPLSLLARLTGTGEERLEQSLWEAVEEGILLPPQEMYRFSHDRVRQVVYGSMEEAERAKIHLHIGRLLQTEEGAGKTPFSAVSHLNQGIPALTDEEERLTLVRLNLEAGRQAKRTAALKEAARYLETGWQLLTPRHWREEVYGLTLDLALELAEAFYLLEREEEGKNMIAEILRHAKGKREVQRVYHLLILLHTHKERYTEAAEAGLSGLAYLGLKVPPHPGRKRVIWELIKTKLLLTVKKPSRLLRLPPMKEEKRLLMELLIYLNSPAFHYDANLVSSLMLKAVRYTMIHGRSDLSILAFNNYALFLSAGLQDYEAGESFCLMSIRLAEELEDDSLMGRTLFVYGVFISHWLHPYRESEEKLKKAKEYTLRSSYFSLAGAITSFIVINLLISGAPLRRVRAETEAELSFAKELQFPLAIDYLDFILEGIRQLAGEERENSFMLPTWRNASSFLPYLYYYLMVSYHTGRIEEGFHAAGEGEKEIGKTLLFAHITEITFYHGLLLAEKMRKGKIDVRDAKEERKAGESVRDGKGSPGERGGNLRPAEDGFENDARDPQAKGKALEKRHRKKLRRIIRRFRRLSRRNPANFLHKALILEALEKDLAGRDEEASRLYEWAAEEAGRSGILQDEAIACGLAHRFYRERGGRIAAYYLQEMKELYRKWGAIPSPIFTGEESEELRLRTDEDQPGRDSLDLYAMLRTSQAISEEVVLSRLLHRLMQIYMENAAARKGALLWKEGESWILSAYAKVKEGGKPEISLPGWRLLPHGEAPDEKARGEGAASDAPDERAHGEGVVCDLPYRFFYGLFAREDLTSLSAIRIADAKTHPIYGEDSYFARHKTHSLLILPIRHYGRLTGMLYLENDLMTDAFPPDRIRVLSLLSTQGAISIATARLYARIEEEVRHRTEELKTAYKELEDAHRTLTGMEELRKEILYNVSHDLRSPLAAVQGYVDYLIDGGLEDRESAERYLSRMKERLSGANRLLDDLFNLIEVNMRDLTLRRAPLQASVLLSRLAESLAPAAEKAGLAFTLLLPEGDDRVEADEYRIGQVLTNLIDNAVKFTLPGGSITLTASWQERENLIKEGIYWADGETGWDGERFLLIAVADTGTGIAEEDYPRIFQRFYSGAPPREGYASHGLGLAICREIVERHGGRIGVKSLPGKGSTFYFTLTPAKKE